MSDELINALNTIMANGHQYVESDFEINRLLDAGWDVAKAYLAIESHLGGCVVVDSEGITHFGVRLPSPPAKDYVNTLEEFRAALAIAMKEASDG